jgi:putative FmdB family regulatory protein
MPLYEYQCEKCKTVFEIIQKFSDEPLSVHENCGGALERLVSAPALQFKGSGWYITDYAKSGSSDKPAKKGGEGSKGDSSPSSSSSSESSSSSSSDSKSSSSSTSSSTPSSSDSK